MIEFRPAAGFIQPPSELVTLSDGDPPLLLERDYYESAISGTGSLRVSRLPTSLADTGVAAASRAQWRLADDADTAWQNSGQAISRLPAAVSFEAGQNDTDLPYIHVGQVRSASGSHSGFVVKSKVVATVAQAVFDEAYPIGGTAHGRMHATAPFTWEQGKTFSSTAIRGLGGDNNTDGGITQTSVTGSLSTTQAGRTGGQRLLPHRSVDAVSFDPLFPICRLQKIGAYWRVLLRGCASAAIRRRGVFRHWHANASHPLPFPEHAARAMKMQQRK